MDSPDTAAAARFAALEQELAAARQEIAALRQELHSHPQPAGAQEDASTRHLAELALANEAMRRSLVNLVSFRDTRRFLDAVLLQIIQASQTKAAGVFAYEAASHSLWLAAFVSDGAVADIPTDPRLKLWRDPLPVDSIIHWESLLKEGILWIDNDAPSPESLPETASWRRSMGQRMVAAIPLLIGSEPVGFLGFGCDRGALRADEARLELCHILGQHVALALQIDRLTAQARQGAVSEERTRMAGEIHDTLAQGFVGILVQLEAARRQLTGSGEPDGALPHLDAAQALARENLDEARRSVWALSAGGLEADDLAAALQALVKRLPPGARGRVEVHSRGEPVPRLPLELANHLYRIAQEAVANALKHAGSTARVAVSAVFSPGAVRLRVRDDGLGFDAASARQQDDGQQHFGLVSMQERAARVGAKLTIGPRADGSPGTEVSAEANY